MHCGIETLGNTVYISPMGFEERLIAELAAEGLAIDCLLADVAGAPFDPEGDQFAVVIRPKGK